jgi:hypothetical protein
MVIIATINISPPAMATGSTQSVSKKMSIRWVAIDNNSTLAVQCINWLIACLLGGV